MSNLDNNLLLMAVFSGLLVLSVIAFVFYTGQKVLSGSKHYTISEHKKLAEIVMIAIVVHVIFGLFLLLK